MWEIGTILFVLWLVGQFCYSAGLDRGRMLAEHEYSKELRSLRERTGEDEEDL